MSIEHRLNSLILQGELFGERFEAAAPAHSQRDRRDDLHILNCHQRAIIGGSTGARRFEQGDLGAVRGDVECLDAAQRKLLGLRRNRDVRQDLASCGHLLFELGCLSGVARTKRLGILAEGSGASVHFEALRGIG